MNTDKLTNAELSIYYERGLVLRNKNFQNSRLAFNWLLDDPDVYADYIQLTTEEKVKAYQEFVKGFNA